MVSDLVSGNCSSAYKKSSESEHPKMQSRWRVAVVPRGYLGAKTSIIVSAQSQHLKQIVRATRHTNSIIQVDEFKKAAIRSRDSKEVAVVDELSSFHSHYNSCSALSTEFL